MFGKLFRFLGGPPPREVPRTPSLAPMAAEPPPGPAEPVGTGPAGTGKVFSSRAVRDATVVNAAIEAMRRFADGQDGGDDLAFRLEGLSPEQTNFLQLSAEPTLLQRCLARAETARGPKAVPLRRLLADLAGPAPLPSMPYPAAPRSVSPIPAAPPRAEAPSLPKAPTPPKAPALAAAPARPAAIPAVPRPAAPTPAAKAEAAPSIVPPLASLADTPPGPASMAEAAPVPPVALPPKPAESPPGLPRLDRSAAEARRAKLIDSLSDHLSADEAAP